MHSHLIHDKDANAMLWGKGCYLSKSSWILPVILPASPVILLSFGWFLSLRKPIHTYKQTLYGLS